MFNEKGLEKLLKTAKLSKIAAGIKTNIIKAVEDVGKAEKTEKAVKTTKKVVKSTEEAGKATKSTEKAGKTVKKVVKPLKTSKGAKTTEKAGKTVKKVVKPPKTSEGVKTPDKAETIYSKITDKVKGYSEKAKTVTPEDVKAFAKTKKAKVGAGIFGGGAIVGIGVGRASKN